MIRSWILSTAVTRADYEWMGQNVESVTYHDPEYTDVYGYGYTRRMVSKPGWIEVITITDDQATMAILKFGGDITLTGEFEYFS